MRICILFVCAIIAAVIPALAQSSATIDTVIQLKLGSNPRVFTRVVWSPDASRVLTSDQFHSVKIWDAVTGALLDTLLLFPDDPDEIENSHGNDVKDIAWSPDGSKIVTVGADNTMILWDAATGDTIRTRRTQSPDIVAWNRDGTRIATRSYIESEGRWRVVLWDASTGAVLDTLATNVAGNIDEIAWSPDGSKLATTGLRMIIWDVATATVIHDIIPAGQDFEWSPDGTKFLSTHADTLKLWDAQSGTLLRSMGGHPNRRPIDTALWSPDGSNTNSMK